MSNIGKGNNFYIEKDEDCRGAFALELGGLLSLYAQKIKVTVTPSGNISLSEFLSSYAFEEMAGYRGITEGKLSYEIDDIFVGEKKHAIIRFSVPKASTAVCARKTTVCSIELEYLDVETKKEVTSQVTAKIQYVKAGKVASKGNDEVKKQLAMIEAAKIQIEAKTKADAGDYTGAQEAASRGVLFATNSEWLDNSEQLAQNFTTLGESMSNRYDYQTKGLKLATAYSCSFSKGRTTTMDSLGTTYNSDIQKEMLTSFSAGSEDAVQESSNSGSSFGDLTKIGGVSGSDIVITNDNGTESDESAV